MARDSWLGLSGFALLALHAHCAYAQNVNCRFYGDDDGRIEGDVEIAIPCTLTDVEIDGDETTIESTNIDGDMFAIGNTGGLLISGNSFEENLDCTDNTPPPVGIANRVDDGAEGQCADLQPEGSTPAPTDTITPPPTSTLVAADGGGGAGALGWPVMLLLPLLFLRRNGRAKTRVSLR